MARLLFGMVVLTVGLQQSCTRFRKKVEEPVVRNSKGEPREIDVPLANVTNNNSVDAPAAEAAEPASSPSPTVKCEEFGKLPSAPPVGVGKPPFVVTRVLKKCTTAGGKDGYEPESPYLAMGFPCTGGGGEVTTKGNSYEPKMVAFRLAIGCPMNPKDAGTVSATLKKDYGVFDNAKLIAYTPFEIQYWELEAYNDADVGSVVELRNAESLRKGWEAYQKKEPLAVRLLGRESSWIKGGQYLLADAKIVFENARHFRLEVDSVKPLSDTEYQALKQKCFGLQPKRDCAEAFSD